MLRHKPHKLLLICCVLCTSIYCSTWRSRDSNAKFIKLQTNLEPIRKRRQSLVVAQSVMADRVGRNDRELIRNQFRANYVKKLVR